MQEQAKVDSSGILAGVIAFIIWGVLPIYWKFFQGIDSTVIVCHRVIWSLVALVFVMLVTGQMPAFWRAGRSPSFWRTCIPAAILIAANWLLFIWAVQHGRVIETSLGYFLNPLCNVALAVVLLKESINRYQVFAIGIALAAVLVMLLTMEETPWVAVVLAVTFATYSLLKKQSKLPAGIGLALETSVLAPLAVVTLFFLDANHTPPRQAIEWAMLVSAGPITTVPLFLFAFAASRCSFVTLGMMQYISPTLGLLIGWLIYLEPMPLIKWIAFGCVWLSLAIYTFDLMRRSRIRRKKARFDANEEFSDELVEQRNRLALEQSTS